MIMYSGIHGTTQLERTERDTKLKLHVIETVYVTQSLRRFIAFYLRSVEISGKALVF